MEAFARSNSSVAFVHRRHNSMLLSSMSYHAVVFFLAAASCLAATAGRQATTHKLEPERFRHYVEAFNRDEPSGQTGMISNDDAWTWMTADVPFFESSDRQIEEMYYFRWWTFRKHIRRTPEGFVVTEFLPDVPWAGAYN